MGSSLGRGLVCRRPQAFLHVANAGDTVRSRARTVQADSTVHTANSDSSVGMAWPISQPGWPNRVPAAGNTEGWGSSRGFGRLRPNPRCGRGRTARSPCGASRYQWPRHQPTARRGRIPPPPPPSPPSRRPPQLTRCGMLSIRSVAHCPRTNRMPTAARVAASLSGRTPPPRRSSTCPTAWSDNAASRALIAPTVVRAGSPTGS